MNPCRCGYYGHPTKKCSCKAEDIKKYLSKISGPLLDRIDIQIEVPSVSYGEMTSDKKGESSATVRERVNAARRVQLERFKRLGITDVFCNADITPSHIRTLCKVDEAGSRLLEMSFEKMGLSARGYDRILRVARTIADLDGSEEIGARHVAEAVQLRTLDRQYFNS
jgi:magnesium chelatase family protein